MKKMLKSALAFALCLALLAAIVPATALAVEAEPKTGDIVPGEILIKLKDSYFGDLAELFPEIDIESYEDLCDIVHHKPVGDDEQKYLGKTFCIKLSEKTVEAVEKAVALLNGREEVEYAEPNIYLGACDEVPPVDEGISDGLKPGDIVPGVVSVGLNEAYVGNPAELFPYLEIEEIRDQYLSVVISSGKTVDNVNESIRKMIGTTFVIKLAGKTERAVYEAIALLTEDSRVKYAEPDHVVGPDIVVPDIGTPTITDALAVLRVAAGLVPATPEVIYLFDKDGDGKITVTDALMVLRIAAKLA